MIKVFCGQMRNPLQHAQGRMVQAFEALDKIETEGTSFEERMQLIEQLKNDLETIQMDMERAKLLF
ncbi:hypothetical protein [Maridesulfovibrio sp.]|uniref:hypothetical protein n=1 Tax=Maridesulfovibrio sp. TaxID=2795000 RepID=UPI0029CA3112|nr:hypothetical protein [Maridesulfovibrio sp.]